MKKPVTKESMRLNAAITESQIKPADLARTVGCSPAEIYQWRRALRPVPATVAPKLAAALNVAPEAICAAYAQMLKSGTGTVVPFRPLSDEEQRRPDLVIARLENDIQALRYAVGALVGAMVVHRPAEASEVVRVMRKRIPPRFQEVGLIAELVAMMESRESA